jgi:hypothetical protein
MCARQSTGWTERISTSGLANRPVCCRTEGRPGRRSTNLVPAWIGVLVSQRRSRKRTQNNWADLREAVLRDQTETESPAERSKHNWKPFPSERFDEASGKTICGEVESWSTTTGLSSAEPSSTLLPKDRERVAFSTQRNPIRGTLAVPVTSIRTSSRAGQRLLRPAHAEKREQWR